VSSTETASQPPQLSCKYRKQNSRNRGYHEAFISGITEEIGKKSELKILQSLIFIKCG